ncbi:MAG: hypothetical protein K2X39_08030, partial [Silvanigrellaceae bacterium]|nr:hypothetical protein [Silvanigrellaceae bacterium]
MFQFFLVAKIAVVVTIASCFDKKTEVNKKELSNNVSEKKQGSGVALFRLNENQSEVADAKDNFFKKTYFERLFTPQRILNLNINRSKYHFAPLSPVFEIKNEGVPFVPLSIKFPEVFRMNIPKDLRDRIEQYDIDNLELLFTAQQFDFKLGHSISLNCGYWLVPQLELDFHETVFKEKILIEVFSPDTSIDASLNNRDINKNDYLKENWLKQYEIQVKDNNTFNDTAFINLKEIHGLFSTWSLVIEPKSKRAAVTLHWLMDTA